MLPDNAGLKALIDAATPGKWEWRYAKHRQSLRVMRPKEGCQESYTVILETDGDRDGADYRGATKADCELIAHAPEMAAELIRLRDETLKIGGLMMDRAVAVAALNDAIHERDAARKEAQHMAAIRSAFPDVDPAEIPAKLQAINRFFPDLEGNLRKYEEARKEAAELRAQLAALTDPSPAAQLARYRAAQTLVENPPKVVRPWSTSGEYSAYDVRLGADGGVEAQVLRRSGYWYVGSHKNGYAETAELARLEADKALTAAGWQLVNE